jgi:hypothetical protein
VYLYIKKYVIDSVYIIYTCTIHIYRSEIWMHWKILHSHICNHFESSNSFFPKAENSHSICVSQRNYNTIYRQKANINNEFEYLPNPNWDAYLVQTLNTWSYLEGHFESLDPSQMKCFQFLLGDKGNRYYEQKRDSQTFAVNSVGTA